MHACYMGVVSYMLCAAVVFLMRSQQRVVDVNLNWGKCCLSFIAFYNFLSSRHLTIRRL